MSSKKFFQDLAVAKTALFDNLSNIRRRELDDGIAFTFSQDLKGPIEVEVVIQTTDVASYRKGARFMVFTSTESSGIANVALILDKLSRRIPGDSTVSDILKFISDRLSMRLSAAVDDTLWDEAILSGDESDDPEDLGFADDSFFASEMGGEPGSGAAYSAATARLPTIFTRKDIAALKEALKKAQAAGISVGLLPAEQGKAPRVTSLSIRVSQLGLPADALEAWDLKPSEYLVLLVRFTAGYPSLKRYLELPTDQEDVQFRFGKCAAAKPSLLTARLAFSQVSGDEVLGDARDESASGNQGTCDTFLPNHVSRSIDRQLNRSLHKLLALRRSHRVSWTSAQNAVSTLVGNPRFGTSLMYDVDEEPIISSQAPQALRHDYALDDEEHMSIPLVAMQLALRQLAHCTEYCMACHAKLEDGPGSLKPYVCARPLCLYQYLSLGFGPSLEHEIINSPYVVDLLIGFFYAANRSGLLREFPSGLTLKVPTIDEAAKNMVAHACLSTGTLRIQPGADNMAHILEPYDWVLLVTSTANGVQYYVCRITAVQHRTCVFEILSAPYLAKRNVSRQLARSRALLKDGWSRALVCPFIHDPEGLSSQQRKMSLNLLMCGIPSVLEMRTYLLTRPGRQLSSWDRMNRSAIALMDWIIASNRSHIIQDQPIFPKDAPAEMHNLNEEDDETTFGDKPIRGHLQFRFAQGAPDKEHRFTQQFEEHTVDSDGVRQVFPTLFAWHGSPLGNWHSIIRTGLDFANRLHGRTFGNGVYLSPDMGVSSAYSALNLGLEVDGPRLPVHWPNSQLVVTEAISVCEVVNRPDMFVSKQPHYVVDRVEWIQCRYLYVKVSPTDMAHDDPFPGRQPKDSEGYIAQDPRVCLKGMKAWPFQVPLAAVPACRRDGMRRLTKAGTLEQTGAAPEGRHDNGDTDGGDDLDLLTCDEKTEVEFKGHKGLRNPPQREGADGPALAVKTGKEPAVTKGGAEVEEGGEVSRVTEFHPGTLDYGSLPKLPAPSWAMSSPAALHTLTTEVKDLQKIQTTTTSRELGWYVDVEKVENLFQWIVELHSFDTELLLAKDMRRLGHISVVLEVRFGASFPVSPPFVRVVRPRFLPFARGGGGHVTAGGAICSELLTNSGWSAALTMENVLLQVRLALCELDPPARLEPVYHDCDYSIGEAAAAYRRAAVAHGWQIPADLKDIAAASWE
ncbi:Poly [ADP-ribose] polymerase 8 [Tolypocladium ophioglossoides CBS 100239]|uniref:Poly [ADP-ribose] polymerase 8 n=1 Tax=Tolypocladium ophioglossoides (strain CBS 100239) TaxID=1163406 RepID=A0A0L0NJY8_TOLOC|nr:Poly [ADP-ribose] polymerase 8 [Tolypocladium ophioglossoides CBS 100239]